MEVLTIIIVFWLVLLGIYGALSVDSARRRGRTIVARQKGQQASIRSAAFSVRTGASTEQPVLGGLFSEVETLRMEVETLRSEVSALVGDPRGDKARLRRYRSGQYTELPRTLRQQVREVRNYRHAIGV